MLDADDLPLVAIVATHCLRWFGHAFHMTAFRLPFRAFFTRAGQGWKRRLGGPALTEEAE